MPFAWLWFLCLVSSVGFVLPSRETRRQSALRATNVHRDEDSASSSSSSSAPNGVAGLANSEADPVWNAPVPGRKNAGVFQQPRPRLKHDFWQDFPNKKNNKKQAKKPATPQRTKKKPLYVGNHKNTQEQRERKPNIILFLTDDQDVELGSLEFMPKTRKILLEEGAFFPNSYISTPMCCPSRSSLLTGLYVHNHGVLTNADNCSSTYWQEEHEPKTFATYLANVGYNTGYFGKYLNKYNGSYIPPGWREWAGLVMNSRYYNYTVNVNGQKIKHGFDYYQDYYPDLIANDSINFLRQSKEYLSKNPFLLVMSFPAPHGPEDSAPQYSDMYFNITKHRTPAYDFAPNPDKQWILRWLGKMEPVHHRFTDLLMTKRLQTLQSVDDAVERIYNELKSSGQLENTYMFYTSDHGYHLGQFGLVKGKSFPFEFDTRVPFLVRGPGITPGTIVHNMIGNVDLAPTFLDIAGVEPPPHMDGMSFRRFLNKKKPLGAALPRWRDTYLIERGKLPHSSPKNNQAKLENNTEGAEGDDADGISAGEEYQVPARIERLTVECQKPQYQSPCRAFQKWQCLRVGDTWKMKRCKLAVLKKKYCKCRFLQEQYSAPTLVMSRANLAPLEDEERRMQRAFLRDHLNKDIKNLKPKFLRTFRSKRHVMGKEGSKSDPSDALMSDIVAEHELEEVDLILEDISEEILDLEALRNGTRGNGTVFESSGNNQSLNYGCQLSQSRVTCNRQVYSDPTHWRLSKEYFDRQIRVLRTQLIELKSIRKHLRDMRPSKGKGYEDNPSLLNSVIPESLDPYLDKDESEPELFVPNVGVISQEDFITTSTTEPTPTPIAAVPTVTSSESGITNFSPRRKKIKSKLFGAVEPDNNPALVRDTNIGDVSREENITASSDLVPEVTTTDVPVSPSTHRTRKIKKPKDHLNAKRFGEQKYGGPTVSLGAPRGTPGTNGGRIDVKVYGRNDWGTAVVGEVQEWCPCKDVWSRQTFRTQARESRRNARKKLKEERLRRKERKLKRKRKPAPAPCNLEKMNCFSHDNEHWRTKPLWAGGPFCVCMNANNNTYWCIRTLNATHNSLYCEFITGFVTYYDMRIDPYQLRNIAHTLLEEELSSYHAVLERMRSCKGSSCIINTGPAPKYEKLPLAPGKGTTKRERYWRRHKRRHEISRKNGLELSI